MSRETRFLYRSSALALGGYVTRPAGESLEVQAASVLPMVGGLGKARVENFNYRDLISFRAANSTVAGNESGDEHALLYNTLATVTIEDLNICNIVTADRVVSRLVSEKYADEPELPIQPVGSYFTNLRIAGFPVDCKPNRILFEARTLPELKRMGGDELPSFNGESLRLPEQWAETTRAENGPQTFTDHRSLTSLFRLPRELPAGCQCGDTPWSILIPGFGTVYLGEFLVTRYSRRLAMLRVKMGSPVKGEVTAGYTEGNGTTYP
jgi:hypothetical protein